MGRILALLLVAFVFTSTALSVTPAQAAYSKATSHGKTFCPKGAFYDPRGGGQCWSCPTGTHRTIFPVTAKNACEKRASVGATKATYRGKRKNGKPKGAFHDPRKGGEYWSCPSSHPRRTAYKVTDRRACATKRIVGEKLTKAKFRGKVVRGKPKGAFFDPRKGGEYWSCPTGYRRGVTAVIAKNACLRVTKAVPAKAKFVKGFGCKRGQFFDPRKGGECWSCPAKTFRTTRAVTSTQACTTDFGNILVDGTAVCRSFISTMAKGSKAMNDAQKLVKTVTDPLMAPVDKAMNTITRNIKSPSGMDGIADKIGKAIAPFQKQIDWMASMSADIRRNKTRVRKVLLNPSVMCSGNGRQIVSALRKAGVNPGQRADLFDGMFIKSAHAATGGGTYYVFSIANEGRTAANVMGITVGFSLVTDFKANTRLYFSIGPYTSTRPGFSASLDFMVFPKVEIEGFHGLQNLGLEWGFSPGAAVEKFVKKWPPKIQKVIGALPGGFAISHSPLFNEVPGFGTTIISGSDETGKGKFGLIDITGSADLTVLLVKFK
ncbi:MAG: hypothetical protein ACI9JL_001534 [Paracoccaceae bacterium]|jgi:hypothetical protein